MPIPCREYLEPYLNQLGGDKPVVLRNEAGMSVVALGRCPLNTWHQIAEAGELSHHVKCPTMKVELSCAPRQTQRCDRGDVKRNTPWLPQTSHFTYDTSKITYLCADNA